MQKPFKECRVLPRKGVNLYVTDFRHAINGCEGRAPMILDCNPHPAATAIVRANLDQFDETLYAVSWTQTPDAMKLLSEHPHRIYWYALSKNPHYCAGKLAAKWPEKLDWRALSENYGDWAIDLMQRDQELAKIGSGWSGWLFGSSYASKIHWDWFSKNRHPWAIEHMQQNLDKIDVGMMCSNPHPWCAEYVSKQCPIDQVRWGAVCKNHTREWTAFLLQHPDKIDWYDFSSNPQPAAVAYMMQHLDKVVSMIFSMNPSDDVIDLYPVFGVYPAKHNGRTMFEWYWASSNTNPRVLQQYTKEVAGYAGATRNPNSFVDEYEAVCRAYVREHVAAELAALVWHPRNFARFEELGIALDM